MDHAELILRELQDVNRRLARIEDALSALSALASGSEAERTLQEQRRTRQTRGRRYLNKRLNDLPARARAIGRRRS